MTLVICRVLFGAFVGWVYSRTTVRWARPVWDKQESWAKNLAKQISSYFFFLKRNMPAILISGSIACVGIAVSWIFFKGHSIWALLEPSAGAIATRFVFLYIFVPGRWQVPVVHFWKEGL